MNTEPLSAKVWNSRFNRMHCISGQVVVKQLYIFGREFIPVYKGRKIIEI